MDIDDVKSVVGGFFRYMSDGRIPVSVGELCEGEIYFTVCVDGVYLFYDWHGIGLFKDMVVGADWMNQLGCMGLPEEEYNYRVSEWIKIMVYEKG